MKETMQKLHIQYLQVNVTIHKELRAYRISSFIYQLSICRLSGKIDTIKNNAKLQKKIYTCYCLESPLFLRKNLEVY